MEPSPPPRLRGQPGAAAAGPGLEPGELSMADRTAQPRAPLDARMLRENRVKIGAKVVSMARYVAFQMAEVAFPRVALRKCYPWGRESSVGLASRAPSDPLMGPFTGL